MILENETFEFHQIFVVYTHNLYEHKNNLQYLKLKKDSKSGNYYNTESLAYDELESIKNYCDENYHEKYILQADFIRHLLTNIKHSYLYKRILRGFSLPQII